MGIQTWHSLSLYLAQEQLRRYEEKLEHRRATRRQRKTASPTRAQRLGQCEEDLASMLLLAAGVRRALLDAGSLDKADLAEAIRRMDLADGVADGKLAPAATRPAPQPPPSIEEYLRRLADESSGSGGQREGCNS